MSHLLLAISIIFSSNDSCIEPLEDDRMRTLQEFVDHSSQIAVYNVSGIEELPSDLRSAGITHAYTLVIEEDILGGAEQIVEVHGGPPFQIPPQEYFSLHDQQESISLSNRVISGSTVYRYDVDGDCVPAPRMVVGYSYTRIVSEIDSRRVYEPVLDRNHSPWVSLLRTVVGQEN